MSQNSFGSWLRRRRKALDLTQDELARRVHCSLSLLTKIENGARRPSKPLAGLLAGALDLTAGEAAAFIGWVRSPSSLEPPASLLHMAARPLRKSALLGPTNLPSPLSPFIGRQQELSRLRECFLESGDRLLTLIGAPGVGKTRLSIQAGHALRELFLDGVFFLPLAPIREADFVLSAIAQAVGARPAGQQSYQASLTAALREKHMLLVLDNFEQVLSAAAPLAEILVACPRLHTLVTSRESLSVRGERLLSVPPLPLPARAQPLTIEAAGAAGAVAMFVERAQAVNSAFMLSDDNLEDVVEICTRLDGLPLALELVAARSLAFTPSVLRARLHTRLNGLTAGLRDAPVQQQTLRGAIDWSHALLSEAEQALFAGMAVFEGGGTLDAVRAVCAPDSESLFAEVASLSNKSLLRPSEENGQTRYSMLETIREYAAEQLAARGDAPALRRRHAGYYLALAEAAEPKVRETGDAGWLERLERDHDNLRAALRWLLESGEAGLAGRLGGALWPFWWARGHIAEARMWLAALLAHRGAIEKPALARLLKGMGVIANFQSDYAQSQACLEELLALSRESGDKVQTASTLNSLAHIADKRGDHARARVLLEECLVLFRESGVRRGVAVALQNLAQTAADEGNFDEAARRCEEALGQFRDVEDWMNTAVTLNSSGYYALARGDVVQGLGRCTEALALSRERGFPATEANALNNLAWAALMQADVDRAVQLAVESLKVFQKLDRWVGIAESLARLAHIAAVQGRCLLAARLAGAVHAIQEARGLSFSVVERAAYERMLAAARAQSSETAWAAAWAEGQSLSADQAVAHALSAF